MDRLDLKKIAFVMVLVMHSLLMRSQNSLVIKGVVSEKDREPIPGATIVLKGTKNGTVTYFDGNYKVTIPDSLNSFVLQYSYVGYLTKEVQFTRDAREPEKFTIKTLSDDKK